MYCSTVPPSPARHRLCLDFFASLASKGDGHLHFDHSSGFGRNVLSFVTISETLEKERSAKPKFHVINSSSFRTRSSTSVLLRFESILSLESYCKLAPTRMHSTFDQEDFLDGFRTPHHSAFFHSAAPDRSLDIGCRRWRDQHRIPRRQLARRLLFPFQGCQGRLARRDSSDASQRNYYGRTGTRPVPWPR